jgi:hypothetical protein
VLAGLSGAGVATGAGAAAAAAAYSRSALALSRVRNAGPSTGPADLRGRARFFAGAASALRKITGVATARM